jgi:hypothetical protein
MATTIKTMERNTGDRFVVIHPLDDTPENKVDIASLGPMAMTPSVRIALLSLRAYLILMMVLVLYHILDLAKVLG